MTKHKQTLKQPHVTHMRLADITTNPDTFQFRDEDLNEAHAKELCAYLRPGQPLDALTLWREPETSALIVIDGHHRLEAYWRFGWDAKVPARVYSCDLNDARKLALEENAKVRLSLSPQERANAAWRLVCIHDDDKPVYSKAAILDLRLVSDGLIAKMRRTRLQLIEVEEEMPNTWLEAQEILKGMTKRNEDWDADVWVQARADALDAKVGKLIGDEFQKCDAAAVSVVDKRAGRQGRRHLLESWGAVEVCNTSEAMLTLSCLMGENLSLKEIDEIAEGAKQHLAIPF